MKISILFFLLLSLPCYSINKYEETNPDIFPTIMIIHNRNEIGRLEQPGLNTLEDQILKIQTSH